MPHWLVWVIVAGALAVGEVLTLTFILGPLAVAAGVTAGAAAFDIGLTGELTVFAVSAVATLLALKPLARRHQHVPIAARTGVAALTGQMATVIEPIDANGGRIKLAGEVWSAAAFEEGRTFSVGARVTVVEIAGATAIVME